ncbi:MAG: Trk family potassium uptake protein [Firmicutes bacterium]|nr:Trk family potassium uptake protein [Bacillota bacterium]
MKKKRIKLSPNQIIAAGFLAIILLGTVLLKLPFVSREGRALPFLDSLFTATSATCVTGLVVADTWNQFNFAGQLILLLLIQTGGLGYMTMVMMASILLGKKISLRGRSIMAESVSIERLSDSVSLPRYIIAGTLGIEGLGAVLLSFRFVPELGFFRGIWYAVFHSVSAFCNAGFDLMGFREPYASLTYYAEDPLVNITVCGLVLLGGLGFIVWRDVWNNGLHFRRYSLHSKLMLVASLVLTLGGAFLFWLAERGNTLSEMPLQKQAVTALFQAVSPRTAGFNTIDTSALSGAGSLLVIVLMFVGAGPGSTGGGVKVTTVTVCLMTLFSYIRGRREVGAFNRRLNEEQIRRASAGMTLYLALTMTGCFIMLNVQPLPLRDIMFEIFSAMSTVGLSTGITRMLVPVNRVIIIILMFCGRIGSLTMMMAMAQRIPPRIKDPVENIAVG